MKTKLEILNEYIIQNMCPNHFGLPRCEKVDGTCSKNCEECWNEEVDPNTDFDPYDAESILND